MFPDLDGWYELVGCRDVEGRRAVEGPVHPSAELGQHPARRARNIHGSNLKFYQHYLILWIIEQCIRLSLINIRRYK